MSRDPFEQPDSETDALGHHHDPVTFHTCGHCEDESPAVGLCPECPGAECLLCASCYASGQQRIAERDQELRIRARELREDDAVDAYMDRVKEGRL